MKLLSAFILLLSLNLFAHDEGHGPAITDESMQGGKVTAIINYKEVNNGRKAKMLYKGELVVEGTNVKLYVYDKNMKDVSLDKFSNTVDAVQLERGNSSKFTLKLSDNKKYFEGKRLKNKRVPYNIDVKIKQGDKTLFGAFDGLDK
jgi:nitrogen fixation protein FixH